MVDYGSAAAWQAYPHSQPQQGGVPPGPPFGSSTTEGAEQPGPAFEVTSQAPPTSPWQEATALPPGPPVIPQPWGRPSPGPQVGPERYEMTDSARHPTVPGPYDDLRDPAWRRLLRRLKGRG
ncbi:hypothetical protein VSH64_21510 [Amycolatopsis rhabdoformis]|uniref:Uncharacterized protein n=1 Tax=Amycolatopsis rhabdoformis TaxID=1448059 RepID=A0ABZ1IKC1_9PSEU|nr:hypothetical protein [Amycolatopsis rhabdoformis]WSE34625.1 hypothetical protein VSH64_21510 [Amycolatopsis rhabdoformis]